MASAVTKTTERRVDLYGVAVPESVAVGVNAAIEAKTVEVSEGYTPEAGPNKGQYQKYDVSINAGTLKDLGITPDKDETGKELGVSEPFTALEAKDFSGALALCGGSESDVWDNFNRAFNQSRRQAVRNGILAKLEGPQKKINKVVENLVAMGIPREIAEAKAVEMAELAKTL